MRHSASILFTLVILFAALSQAPAGDLDAVKLNPKATVSGEDILLGDVASIRGPHAEDLAALPLVKSPKTPAGLTLSAQFVASRIKEKRAGVSVVMEGAPQVLVGAMLTKISGAELEALYRDAVAACNPFKGRGSVGIKDVKAPAFVFVPEKDKPRLQAKFSPGEDFLGLVTATISAGDSPSEICRVSGKIQVTAQVPVARRLIRRGEVISEDDLELKDLEISTSPHAVREMGECLGMRAKTTLQAGKPLLGSNIVRPPLISRGDLVCIEARSEGLVVADKGIALKDGGQGEMIPIKNVKSGKQVIGTIIAHSLVEVTF